MKQIEAGNTDAICKEFSPEVREGTSGLYGHVRDFIRFIEEDITSWDFSSGNSTSLH